MDMICFLISTCFGYPVLPTLRNGLVPKFFLTSKGELKRLKWALIKHGGFAMLIPFHYSYKRQQGLTFDLH